VTPALDGGSLGLRLTAGKRSSGSASNLRKEGESDEQSDHDGKKGGCDSCTPRRTVARTADAELEGSLSEWRKPVGSRQQRRNKVMPDTVWL
jgi:hypothetical protein